MESHDVYTLRLPFQLQQGRALSEISQSSSISFDDLTIKLASYSRGYSMQVDGFPSEQAAGNFLPQAWAGLTNVMLQLNSAFSGSFTLAPVTYTPQTDAAGAKGFAWPLTGRPLDGITDGDAPSVYPSNKRIGFLGVGTPTVTISTPAGMALSSLTAGFRSSTAAARFQDERFRIAVDLFAAALFEESPAARLLTFTMAIEVLAPVTYKHPSALDLIERWKVDLATARSSSGKDREAIAGLDSLERELLFRRETSIRGRIRDFVRLELATDSEVDSLTTRALRGYDARSELLHEGTLQPSIRGEAIENLKVVLKRIIAGRLALPAA